MHGKLSNGLNIDMLNVVYLFILYFLSKTKISISSYQALHTNNVCVCDDAGFKENAK